MKIILHAAVAAMMLAAPPHSASAATPPRFATSPRAAWAELDPADSLYRAARRALNDKDYEAAARMFDRIVSSYPKSEYAPDALYWKGLALYRNGDLDAAQKALETQASRYANAPTRTDASTLLVLIRGQLAKRGDAGAASAITREAASAGKSCADIETQIAALDALQQMDAERVVPLLKRVLARRDDCSVPLRKNALFVLAQKGGTDRENILLDVAKSDPNASVRADAVFHLSQGSSDATVSALEDILLHTTDRATRSNALFALANQRSERARPVIRNLVLQEDAPVPLRNDAVFHLASGKTPDTDWLMGAYGKVANAEVRKTIMFHVAQRGTPDVGKWLAAIIADPKESADQRKDAMFHLASKKTIGTETLVAVFDRITPDMKKELLFHIAARHDAASLDKLIAVAKGDPSPDVRKDALFYISQSKDPRALKALEDIVVP